MEIGQGTGAIERKDRSEKVADGHEKQKRIEISDCEEIHIKQAAPS
jgi:hypothetical protein